jgi:hypothetical protein
MECGWGRLGLMEMDEKEFELLTQILDGELEAQFGVERLPGAIEDCHLLAVLLADAVWDQMAVARRFR